MRKNVFVKDPETVHISDKAIFEISNNKTVTISGNCTIDDNALIVADTEDCVISDSYISSNVRIRNSRIESVYACPGSQILETNIVIVKNQGEKSKKYFVTLNPGTSYDDENFAFSRGAVIKRIKDLRVEDDITIPVGHSLISFEELERITIRNDRKIRIRQNIAGKYFIINAQYSHAEIYEQFYDPERFDRYRYLTKTEIEDGNIRESEFVIDISAIMKSEFVKNKKDLAAIIQIRKDSDCLERMLFLDREKGITVIER